jgi:hypothetical protein
VHSLTILAGSACKLGLCAIALQETGNWRPTFLAQIAKQSRNKSQALEEVKVILLHTSDSGASRWGHLSSKQIHFPVLSLHRTRGRPKTEMGVGAVGSRSSSSETGYHCCFQMKEASSRCLQFECEVYSLRYMDRDVTASPS